MILDDDDDDDGDGGWGGKVPYHTHIHILMNVLDFLRRKIISRTNIPPGVVLGPAYVSPSLAVTSIDVSLYMQTCNFPRNNKM